jgi:hypothetical protein
MHDPEADPQGWSRSGLDSLAHAAEHMRVAADADRRIALVSIDQGVEALITSYLRRGPGASDGSPAAEFARRPHANFWPKRDYVLELADRARIETPAGDDFSLVRSIRNEIQHSGEWVIPTVADVGVAFAIARATLRALDCLEAAAAIVPKVRGSVASPVRQAPVPKQGRQLTGRHLAEAAWNVSIEIDPSQDGVHVRVLGERLASLGLAWPAATSLRDAMNHAHDLFVAHGEAVWSWRDRAMDVGEGTFGRELADVVYTLLAQHDPHGNGMHAGRDILPLLNGRVTVRGQDKPATIRRALDGDDRFETVANRQNKPGERLRTAYRLRK